MHPWQHSYVGVGLSDGDCDPEVKPWTPESARVGEEIELEAALRIENRVLRLRRELKLFTPLQSVLDSVVDPKDQQSRWEENSAYWIKYRGRDANRELVIDPAMWTLIGDVSGLRVLDAGCGNGYFSRDLARKGALVVGVDYSQTFIDFCRQKEEELKLGCEFVHCSITEMDDIENETFDLVVSNVVITDVQDYQNAFREIHRVLKTDGRFIWSNPHPVFGYIGAVDIRFPLDSPRGEDRYLKMIDRYFDSGGTLVDWLNTPIWQFHRTLSEYSAALKEAGFAISEIVEPRPSIEDIQEHPRFLAFDADRWTQFIILECVKR